MKYTGMSFQEATEVFQRGSIIEMMFSFRMFDKADFDSNLAYFMNGARDAWEGIAGIVIGLYRTLIMFFLYATWPISKPIMCAVYLSRFWKNHKKGN